MKLVKLFEQRRTFMKIWGTAFGVVSAVVFVSLFGKYGSLGWWIFLILLAVPIAWVWSFLVWHALSSDIRRLSSDSMEQRKDDRNK